MIYTYTHTFEYGQEGESLIHTITLPENWKSRERRRFIVIPVEIGAHETIQKNLDKNGSVRD